MLVSLVGWQSENLTVRYLGMQLIKIDKYAYFLIVRHYEMLVTKVKYKYDSQKSVQK